MTMDKETFIKFIQDQGLVNVTGKLPIIANILTEGDLFYGLPTLSPYSWIVRVHDNKIMVVNKIINIDVGIDTFDPRDISEYFDVKAHIKYLIERSIILLKEEKERMIKDKMDKLNRDFEPINDLDLTKDKN